MKKLFCFVVIFALLSTLMIGCGPKTETNTNQTTSTATSSNDKEWMDISIGWDGALSINDDELGKWLQDKLKINFKPESVTGDKLRLLATTDELPDIFTTSVGSAMFSQFKNEEYIRDIPEDLLANYPRVKKMVDDNVVTQAYKKLSGKLWDIPHPADATTPSKAYMIAFNVRWDWAQDMGVTKVPETTDEFYELLKKYRNDDPDKNGKKDTYGIGGKTWSVHYIPWVDEYNWVKEDGKWIPGYLTKDMLPALKWWNRLVQEDIMPGDFANSKSIDDFMNNKTGALQHNGDSYHLWDKMVVRWGGSHKEYLDQNKKTVQDCLKVLPPLKRDANTPPRWSYKIDDGGTVISSKVDDKKLARILEFYEFCMSPDGQDLLNFGFKGKDYKVINGKAYMTLPPSDTKIGEQKKLWEVYPSVQIASVIAWNVGRNLQPAVDIFPEWIIQKDKELKETLNPITVVPNVAINKVITPSKEKNQYIESWDQVESDLCNIISGTNVEKDFEALKTKYLTTYECQKVIDEVNEAVIAQNLEKAQ